MINKIKINGKTTYLVLVGIIFVLSSFIVYAGPSEMGHSINEIDWSTEIQNLQVQNLFVRDTIEITDLPLNFPSGLTSNEIHADEDLFAETFFTASQIRTHELYLGTDYATAPFISDWDNLSSIVDNNLWIPFETQVKIDWNGNPFEWDAGGVTYGEGHQISPFCDASYAGHKSYKVVGAQPNSEWQEDLCSYHENGYYYFSGYFSKVNELPYDTYIYNYYTYPQGVGSEEILPYHTTKLLVDNGEGICYECGPDNSDNWICEVSMHSTCTL
jgi:hypothetical protein